MTPSASLNRPLHQSGARDQGAGEPQAPVSHRRLRDRGRQHSAVAGSVRRGSGRHRSRTPSGKNWSRTIPPRAATSAALRRSSASRDRCATSSVGRTRPCGCIGARWLCAERLVHEHPRVADYQLILAAAYDNYALYLERTGHPADALAYHARAGSIRDALARQYPGSTVYRTELFRQPAYTGETLVRTGEPAEALADLKKAEAMLAAIVQAEPHNQDALEWLERVRIDKHDALRAMNRIDAATESLEPALADLEKLVAEYPEIPWYRTALARCLNRLGTLRHEAGRTSKAERDLSPGGRAVRQRPRVIDLRTLRASPLPGAGWRAYRASPQRPTTKRSPCSPVPSPRGTGRLAGSPATRTWIRSAAGPSSR